MGIDVDVVVEDDDTTSSTTCAIIDADVDDSTSSICTWCDCGC